MKLIFVAGLEESGKDTLLNLVLNSKNKISDFDRIAFDDIIFSKTKRISPRLGHRALTESLDFCGDMGEMAKLRDEIHKKLEKKIKSCKKPLVVINGYFTIKTYHGYVPVMTDQFFKKLRPDMIILMEADVPEKSRHLLKKGPDYLDSLKLQQEIDRNCASLYASVTNAVLKIIKVRHGDVKTAIRKLTDTLTFAMK